jgi:hypothetical protein
MAASPRSREFGRAEGSGAIAETRFHIYVDSKASWFEIADAMKQYPADNE